MMESVVATLMLATPIASALSPGDNDLAPTPVHVRVTAEEPTLSEVTDCLQADLEQTSDVIVSDDPSALTLDVIVAEQKLTDDSLMGYLIYVGGYLPGPTQPDDVIAATERPVVIRWQTLRMARPDLDAACETIADGFKTEVIEPVRAELERIRAMSPARTKPADDDN